MVRSAINVAAAAAACCRALTFAAVAVFVRQVISGNFIATEFYEVTQQITLTVTLLIRVLSVFF